MNLIKDKQVPIEICIAYTVINISGSVMEAILASDIDFCMNNIMMILWTAIAVFVLHIHHLFDEWSPLAMIIIQYIVALGLVMLTPIIGGIFSSVSYGGYRDVFWSFTIPYGIGAIIYYINLMKSVQKQNKLIEDINRKQRE